MIKKFTKCILSFRVAIGLVLMLGFMGVAKSQNVNVTATAGTTSGTYPNLSTAFASINNGTHQGAITVDITASFTDVATAFLNSSGASTGSSYTSVLVRPTVDAVTISFASASGFGVIDINGADNVTIDGDNPNTAGTNRNLTIVNTAASTTTFTSVIRVAVGTIAPQLDNNNITIKNIIANGSATSCNSAALTSATVGGQNTTFGVVVAPGGGPTSSFAVTNTTTPFNASATVNAFMVDNCAINQCGRGIAFLGAGATSSTGITITNNTLGTAAALGTYPFTTPTTTVYTQGIFVTGANSVTITGNTLNNIVSYVGVAMNGITLNASMGSGTFTISNNTITAVTNNGTSASSSNGILIASATTGATYTISGNTISNIQNSGGASNGGIFISGGSATSGLISNNIISTVYARSTGGWGARGIYLNSGSNITVQNNMIRDISMCPNNSATTTTFGARGILINAGTGHKIYNNSVYLSGPVFTSSNTDVTSCLGIAGTGLTGIDVRNNIFSNTMTGGSATTPHACIQLPSGATSTMNLTLNNNAYYSGSTATSYIGILATTFTGYSAANFNPAATSPATNMRAYTSTLSVAGTNDNASFASTAAAPFISSTDLHLNTGAANITDVDAKAAVIATVTTDIDGNTRDAATPDMGADEVSVAGCVTATGGSIAPTTATVCAGLTYAMSATGSSTGSGITYQWEISTTGGGIGFGNVSGGTGATTVSYTTAALTAGIYYYRLRTTCSSGPVIAYSNELTLTVNALPTISVTPPSAAACGTISQTLTASGASTYTWSPATGLSGTTGTNVTASPTSTTTYTVTGTDVNTCVNTTSVTITIDVMPSTPIMTPSSVNICTGGSTTLNATSSFPTTGTLGTGTSTTTLATTTSTTYPNPYSHYYGGNKHQYLILASELSAMGLSAGSSISSIGFNIASVNTTVPLQSFEIKMGHTAITTIAAFQTGLTIVSPAATYTTGAAPGVNTHTLGTPFVWNGTSNIVLETSYSNNDFSTTGNNTITYSTTPFQSTIVYRADNIAAATMNSYTGATSFVYSQRPNITFGFTAALTGGSITWSPATGLSSTTGNTVTATPASTTTYTATAANGTCSSSSNVTVTVGSPLVCGSITTGTTFCAGQNFTLSVAPTGGGIPYSYVWSDGVGGSYANAASITANLASGTYTFSVTVTDACSNTCTSNVMITVNALPTISVTPATSTLCSTGPTSVNLTASGTSTSYSWAPSTGLSATTGTSVTANPTSTTTYVVTGLDANGCMNTASALVNSNATPATPVISPSAPTVCPGGSVVLSTPASLSNVTGTGTSTTTLATTTSTTYPNPYSHYYGGNKHQYLILASELSAMGLSAGSSISSIGFNIASVNTTVPLQSFEIKMGHTAITTIAAFQTGLTIVSPAATYTTGAAPGVNTHTLGTPFVWNGTSNIVLETSYSNNDFSTTGNNTITYSTTPFQSTIVYRADNIAAATMNSYTGATSFVYSQRPNITFTHSLPLTYTWSPSTGLSSTTGATVTANPASTTTYTLTADNSGCTSSGNVTVTIGDFTNPTITCPTNVTVNVDAGLCTASGVSLGTPVTADNCSVASITNDAPATYPVGTTNVTWTVTDASGNSATCIQTVTVTDNINPTITCPANITTNVAPASCSATVSLGTPTTNDNCGVATTTNNGLASYPVGTTNVTWTVTDVNGNSATCIQTVTVIDNINPTITCPANVSVNADAGLCTASGVSLGTPVTADNCSVASTTNDAPATFPLGSTTVTWTVTDASGNTATCTQTVTVTDNQNPTITCPTNVTVNVDAGLCTASGVSLGTPTTADNCGVATTTNNGLASYPVGTTNVTWTVTDVNGNTATCIQTVTVTDNINPTITCPANITTNVAPASCSATVSLGTPATADNCGVATTTNNGLASYPVGTTNVTWTVTDVNGNSATCIQTVTVIDNINPTITCPANVSVNADAGLCTASGVSLGTPVTADNCSVASTTNDAPATFPLGSTTVTWTVTDASGNSATCTQTVTVTDNQNPTITCPANITTNVAPATCSATVSLGTPATADNCGVATTTNDGLASYPVGTTNVTWTVTDVNGNIATCVQTVTVIDNINPTITCPANVSVNADAGLCTASGVSLGTPVTADNCSVASTTNDAPATFPVGSTTVTWTVTDASGNSATCTQTVTVNDNQNPTITCPANVSVNADAGMCNTSSVSLGTPITSDNCGVATITNDAPATYAVGTTTVTWTVTDFNGNAASCTQTVTVTDNQNPTITCPSNVTVNADALACAATGVSLGTPIVADNCGIGSVTNDGSPSYAVGTTTVTWTVTDVNGNTATCSQTVTVIDNQAPVVSACPSDITINTNNAGCTGIATWTAPTGTDNCGGALVPTSTHNSGDVFLVGTTPVTYTFNDGNGNISTCSFNVIVVNNLMATTTATDALCNGTASGNIDLTVSGGSLAYTFDWDNDGTGDTDDSEDIAVVAGTYNVTVTDADGCIAIATATVNEPTVLGATIIASTDPSGCGVSDGTADLQVTGGTPGYTFDWDNDGTGDTDDTEDQLSLFAGANSVIVTDANGCTATAVVTLTDPNGPTVTVNSITDVLCNGSATGGIDISVTLNGTAVSYTTLWDDAGATTADDLSGVVAGTYAVTVTDNNGCVGSANATINEPGAITIIPATTDPTCNTSTDGAINITVSGGTAGYMFDWDNDGTGDTDDTEDQTGLGDGTYTVTVFDANGCSSTISVTITEPAPISSSAVVSNESCAGPGTGSIDYSATGGTAPYTYSWDNGAITEDIALLNAGNYTVTVTDSKGCIGTSTYTVTGAGPITVTFTFTLCAGQSFSVGTSTYSTSGTYIDSLISAGGCDSIITTNLTVNPAVDVSTSTTSITITANSTSATTYQWVDCNAGMAAIAGETNASYTATADGDYAVIVFESGCPDTSACVNITGVGIEEISSTQFELYPNPNNGAFTVDAKEAGRVTITNSVGQVIYTTTLVAGKNQLNIGSIARGTYTVTVLNNDGSLIGTKRMVIMQ